MDRGAAALSRKPSFNRNPFWPPAGKFIDTKGGRKSLLLPLSFSSYATTDPIEGISLARAALNPWPTCCQYCARLCVDSQAPIDRTITRSSRIPAVSGNSLYGHFSPCFVVRTSRFAGVVFSSFRSNVSICEGPPTMFTKITHSADPLGLTFSALAARSGRSRGASQPPVTLRAPS